MNEFLILMGAFIATYAFSRIASMAFFHEKLRYNGNLLKHLERGEKSK